jgi:flagellar protein FlbD
MALNKLFAAKFLLLTIMKVLYKIKEKSSFVLSFWGKNIMIKLTRLNSSNFVLNCELIETVEATPDTVISTINGKKYVCTETVDEVIELVVNYKRSIMNPDRQLFER